MNALELQNSQQRGAVGTNSNANLNAYLEVGIYGKSVGLSFIRGHMIITPEWINQSADRKCAFAL
jgi:hypothetical protein